MIIGHLVLPVWQPGVVTNPQPEPFIRKREDGSPAPQMTAADVTAFVDHLKMKTTGGLYHYYAQWARIRFRHCGRGIRPSR